MNDNEKKRLQLFEEIISFLRENRETTVNIPGLSRLIQKLLRLMDDIRKTAQEINSAALKRTIKVNQTKDELLFTVIPFISALFHYARDTNDLLLKEKTKLSKSSLVLLRNFELYNKSLSLLLFAESNLRKLHKYGINIKMVNLLKNNLAEFKSVISNGVNSIFVNGTTVTLDFLFSESNKILESIDNLIETYSEDDDFYEEYKFVCQKEMEDEYDKELDYELEEKE